jgi:CDK-activating kinase assembly factor MAT1
MADREVSIRRRISNIYNKRERDFECLLDYNNYLEEVEDIILSIVEGKDVVEMERKIKQYQRANEDSIAANLAKKAEDEANRAAAAIAIAAVQELDGRIKERSPDGNPVVDEDCRMSYAPSVPSVQTQPMPLGGVVCVEKPLTAQERLQIELYAGGYSTVFTRRRAITEAQECMFP